MTKGFFISHKAQTNRHLFALRLEQIAALSALGQIDDKYYERLLEYETEAQKYFLIQELIAIVERLLQQIDRARLPIA